MSPRFRDASLRVRVPSSSVSDAAEQAEGVGAVDEEEDVDIAMSLPFDVDWIVGWSATRSCAGFFW